MTNWFQKRFWLKVIALTLALGTWFAVRQVLHP